MSNDILRDLRGFGTVEKWVLTDPEISTSAKALYALICAYAGNKGQSFPSTSLLSHQLSVSRPTLQKSINQLKDKLVISVEQKRSEGRFSHNVYSLLNQPSPTVAKNTDDGKTDDSISDDSNTDDNEVYTKINSDKNNSVKKNSDEINSTQDVMHDHVMELVEAWNQIQGYNGIEMTKVQSISKTSARYRATVSRIKEHDFDTVYDVLRKVSKSDFLRGDSRTRWTADFGWVMRPTNFEKILEDTYINKGNGNAECNSNNQQNRKLSGFQEFATELSDRVDKNRHILDELPDDYIF